MQRLDEVRARYRQESLARRLSPRDVDLLLRDLLGRSQSWLLAHGEERIDPAPLDALMRRRYAGEPLQYIRRQTEFYGLDFYVDERVLIPRPETEVLVEAALARAAAGARVLDVGTGSGCIPISMERTRPDLRVTAIDLSLDALAVAHLNRRRLGSGVDLVGSDLLSSVRGPFDLIVSNPPYIAAEEVEHLELDVRGYEPHLALTPGPTGLEIIERLLEQAQPRLAPGGRILMEIGYGQADAVRQVAAARGFEMEAIIPDLAAIPRVVVLR
jgi:release factor glutamine methyltransferase